MRRAIVGYHRDDEGHWVARLACGHNQHVRHQPPFVQRPWVVTSRGRTAHLGTCLECLKCRRGEPRDRPAEPGPAIPADEDKTCR